MLSETGSGDVVAQERLDKLRFVDGLQTDVGFFFEMIRKPWGFERVLHRPPLHFFYPVLDDDREPCHFPMFQIVDGHGKRTEHYAACERSLHFPAPEPSFDPAPLPTLTVPLSLHARPH